jgi:hypothetical protein
MLEGTDRGAATRRPPVLSREGSDPPMSSLPQAKARPPVIRVAPGQANFAGDRTRLIPAWIISVFLNSFIFGLFALTLFWGSTRGSGVPIMDASDVVETTVEDPAEKLDLTGADIGNNPAVPLNYDVPRVGGVSVPGPASPDQLPGILGATADAPMANIPAPPGLGPNGLGRGLDSDVLGNANRVGLAGGIDGVLMPGGFQGRSGQTRERLALQGGGNALSEAAVAAGLLWLARHQAPDGHWSLTHFNRNANLRFPDGSARIPDDRSTGRGNYQDDIAGTAFGLLPFLAAGETHKPGADKKAVNYAKVVAAGLRYLLSKQTAEGQFPGTMYTHGLATITICEAYGLTSDPLLRGPAQQAIRFIVAAQNRTLGGWRYFPGATDSDTSVVGWQVMALKSGQMAGLSVPKSSLDLAGKWLDSCMTSDKGGYGYIDRTETPTMTSVGLLRRMYLGWNPRNPGILAGIGRLVPRDASGKRRPAVATDNMYYNYYATQVMHHFGGANWEKVWNPAMRDFLVKTQDHGANLNQKGSWDPRADVHGKQGGRLTITSLSLLTLEVYYRHLPLYRRELGVLKDAAEKSSERK